MKHLKLALLISAITAFAASCASTNTTVYTTNSNAANTASSPAATATGTAAPSDEFAAARSTYNAACVKCHNQNGEGGAVDLGDGEILKVPSFKTGHGLTHTEAQFARQIAKGGDGMPAFERKLSSEQIIDLVRFIRREFQAGLVKDDAPNASH